MDDSIVPFNPDELREQRVAILCRILLDARAYNPRYMEDAKKLMDMFTQRRWKHTLTYSREREAYLATVTVPLEKNLTLLTCNANPAYAISLLGAKLADIANI